MAQPSASGTKILLVEAHDWPRAGMRGGHVKEGHKQRGHGACNASRARRTDEVYSPLACWCSVGNVVMNLESTRNVLFFFFSGGIPRFLTEHQQAWYSSGLVVAYNAAGCQNQDMISGVLKCLARKKWAHGSACGSRVPIAIEPHLSWQTPGALYNPGQVPPTPNTRVFKVFLKNLVSMVNTSFFW